MKISRTTIAKTKITELILQSSKALSHQEVQSNLDGVCDRVTIYRVLNRLIEEKLIHKVVTIDGIIKYAACINCKNPIHNHSHIHFNCEVCKTVTCLSDVEVKFGLPSDYLVNEVNFIVSGICKNCTLKVL